jgi:DNA-directed RNA polymerase specialized sigma24 family protein
MRLPRVGSAFARRSCPVGASYFDDLDVADIARIEGCSAGAAKVRLHRARVRLRQILENDDA